MEGNDNEDEILTLRSSLHEAKEKYFAAEYEKMELHNKNEQLANENRELHLKIPLMKQKYVKNSVDEKTIESLKKEVEFLKG